jgi:hypothetical protein
MTKSTAKKPNTPSIQTQRNQFMDNLKTVRFVCTTLDDSINAPEQLDNTEIIGLNCGETKSVCLVTFFFPIGFSIVSMFLAATRWFFPFCQLYSFKPSLEGDSYVTNVTKDTLNIRDTKNMFFLIQRKQIHAILDVICSKI